MPTFLIHKCINFSLKSNPLSSRRVLKVISFYKNPRCAIAFCCHSCVCRCLCVAETAVADERMHRDKATDSECSVQHQSQNYRHAHSEAQGSSGKLDVTVTVKPKFHLSRNVTSRVSTRHVRRVERVKRAITSEEHTNFLCSRRMK